MDTLECFENGTKNNNNCRTKKEKKKRKEKLVVFDLKNVF